MILNKLIPEIENWTKHSYYDIKVAIIGFGKMGLLHSGILNLLKPGIVKAVVDKSFLLTFGASRIIKSIRFYRSIEKMLREIETDAVYVTTPTSSHYPILKNLLGYGARYVFVEKPPTVDYKQLTELIDMKKSDQCIMVGFQKRYALPFRHAKMLLDNSVIGEVESVYAYIKSGDILSPTTRFDALGRGVLLDLGVHLIDLLTWMFNVTNVISARSTSIHTKVDDQFEAELSTKEGARVNIEITWSDHEYRLPETYIEIHGTEGRIKVTEDYLKVKTNSEHVLLDNKKELTLYKPHYYQGVPPINLADPEYTIENMHLLQAIRNKKQPMTSIENAARTMELIEILYQEAERCNG